MKVAGFQAAGAVADLEAEDTDDVALVVAERPVAASGVFTINAVKAAPILWDLERLAAPEARIQAVVINSGNANACTGESGVVATRAMAEETALRVGCTPEQVLVLSTGVIGVPMDVGRVRERIGRAAARLGADAWREAAIAMMTTDRAPKVAVREAAGMRVVGIAKGAGMIAPNMATMLAVVVTDADLDRAVLDRLLRSANQESFQRIVVDGDMSTNDAVVALASGGSGIRPRGGALAELEGAFRAVCEELACSIVRDGEGATKLVRVEVGGAATADLAEAVARQIGVSPLCKTAFHGADPNWGRVVAAAGQAAATLGVPLAVDRLRVELADEQQRIALLDRGEPLAFDESAAIGLMRGDAWTIRIELGLGDRSTWLWTCDFTAAYIAINAHYRT